MFRRHRGAAEWGDTVLQTFTDTGVIPALMRVTLTFVVNGAGLR
jgi:hypothetical protein